MSWIFVNIWKTSLIRYTKNIRNISTLNMKHKNRIKIRMSNFTRTSSSFAKTEQTPDFKIASPFQGNEIPNVNLVEYLFTEMNEEEMRRPALTCGASGRSYDYAMIRMLINRFAQALLSHCRMRPRETVGLLLPNIPEFVITCHGAMEAGLPVTFVNPLYTANEIRRQFQNAEVKLIATVPHLLDVATDVATELLDYRGTVCVGGDDDVARKVFGLENLLKAGHEANLHGINPKELAVLPYSSGTTGIPKGVMLSHYNLVANLVQVDHPDLRMEQNPDKPLVIFTVLPFFHIFGFNTILNISLRMKLHLISIPRFGPEDYIKCLANYKPNVLFVVPSLVNFLTENSNVLPEHLASIAYIQSGAAPLSDGLIQRFKQKFGQHIKVRQGYGMTESSPVTVMMPQNAPSSKHNTIGTLIPKTFARIVDLRTGDSLEANKPGELQIKGPQVMMGYLNNEKATNETIDEDGWLHTGDVAYYDNDKYFYIIDRCKELIKVKGNQVKNSQVLDILDSYLSVICEKWGIQLTNFVGRGAYVLHDLYITVSPTELENLLLEIPDVADAAVVGIPDALADEIPKAFVVKKPGSEITDKDILKYVNARVVHYKKLAGGCVFLNSIPRNSSGKILRNELKVNDAKYTKS